MAHACAGSNGPWQAAKAITNDALGDFSRVAFVTDTTAVALWQRFDTANPGDLNADPAG